MIDYSDLYRRAFILPSYEESVSRVVKRVFDFKDLYQMVQTATGIPWYLIACIHSLESNLSLDRHLHNGDSLLDRTINHPSGRPEVGGPPFTWSESAIDAFKDISKPDLWTTYTKLYFLESYNGLGYLKRGVLSPYLWSGTQLYSKGKYTSDGVYDPEVVSRQIGAVCILKKIGPF